jgi:hypothetical protein
MSFVHGVLSLWMREGRVGQRTLSAAANIQISKCSVIKARRLNAEIYPTEFGVSTFNKTNFSIRASPHEQQGATQQHGQKTPGGGKLAVIIRVPQRQLRSLLFAPPWMHPSANALSLLGAIVITFMLSTSAVPLRQSRLSSAIIGATAR